MSYERLNKIIELESDGFRYKLMQLRWNTFMSSNPPEKFHPENVLLDDNETIMILSVYSLPFTLEISNVDLHANRLVFENSGNNKSKMAKRNSIYEQDYRIFGCEPEMKKISYHPSICYKILEKVQINT
ncbi:gp225 [Sphingomonas phage PAU]|uniref:gp225 n=1 Tax=Sphingomonas phage PAU TaxID=1150991 RepID=UPI000257337F|nr:gp225 [Sphingomonas phage PAU]AFF28223.1 gp225 [Sphingomonas phage PAU]